MAPQDHPALMEFPQLGRLVELCAAGWVFLHIGNGDGQLTELRGMRMWPSGYADALRLRYVTDGLLALPAPHHPGAPHLVTATLERLWTP